MILKHNYVDLFNQKIYPAEIRIENNRIASVKALDQPVEGYIMPGFVDAHIHIESSMLIPSEFARMAVVHGTIGTVSDPHEIANVMGMEGVYYMIENGKKVPFIFNFGAPSCVPATQFETAGPRAFVPQDRTAPDRLVLPWPVRAENRGVDACQWRLDLPCRSCRIQGQAT